MTADLELSEEKGPNGQSQDTGHVFETTGQIWRNSLVICAGFIFLFTAYASLQGLQSSLFIDEGMGTTVLAVVYGTFVLSAFFVPSPIISSIGCKWTLAISMACYAMYSAAHFYASWELFIPAGILVGLGAAPLWATNSHYQNTLAHDYAKKKGITNDAAASIFFGVFFFFFQSSLIWGNVISSQVLTPADANSSVTPLSAEELAHCGKAFCPHDINSNNTNLEKPPLKQLHMLAGIYTGTTCAAVLIILTLLQQLPTERDKSTCACSKASCKPKLLVATFLHLRDKRQLLLIPLSMFSGLEQAFFAGDFTQAFITCPLGRWWVGYVIICYGATNACCSLLVGKLVQFIGRIPFYILGASINLSVLIALLNMQVTQDHLYIYFILAGLWGVADSIWQTQINALYGVLFKDRSEAAFSNYILWESLGFMIAFGYQSRLCLPVKVYILIGILAPGMLGYGIVEFNGRKKKRQSISDVRSS